jgi:membrane associated rhomboid family serine protease
VLIHASAVDGQPSLRRMWCTWSLTAVVVLAFLAERLAGWSLMHHGPLPEQLSLVVVDLAADGRIYQDPMLFEPWQPWTQVLLQGGWWQLLAGVQVLILVGGALEAELGWKAMLAACLAVLPVSALGAVLFGGEPALTGLDCGLMAMLLARAPRTRIRWGLSYFLFTEVGHVRLFTMGLIAMTALYIAQELLRLWLQGQVVPSGAWALAMISGAALGFSTRWIRRDA